MKIICKIDKIFIYIFDGSLVLSLSLYSHFLRSQTISVCQNCSLKQTSQSAKSRKRTKINANRLETKYSHAFWWRPKMDKLDLWNIVIFSAITVTLLDSGCGSVGKAVDSDSRGQQFESSHYQIFVSNIYFLSTVLKRRN